MSRYEYQKNFNHFGTIGKIESRTPSRNVTPQENQRERKIEADTGPITEDMNTRTLKKSATEEEELPRVNEDDASNQVNSIRTEQRTADLKAKKKLGSLHDRSI